MTPKSILQKIQASVREVLIAKGLEPHTVGLCSPLLGDRSGLDSLDLAGILIDLEYFTGVDPFREGFREFLTAGELAQLYVREQP